MFNKLTDKEKFNIVKDVGNKDIEALMDRAFELGVFEVLRLLPSQQLTIRDQTIFWDNKDLDEEMNQDKEENSQPSDVTDQYEEENVKVPNYHVDEPITS